MGLTYEVAGHLLVLLEPAGVTQLQQGVHVVGAGLQQDLRGGGSCWVTYGRHPAPGLSFLRLLNLRENTARDGEAQSLT